MGENMRKRYDYRAEVSGCVQEPLADDAPDPTAFRQFAVQEPGGEPKQYGDRSYVQYGDVLCDSAPGSVIVERDVEVKYGPWRPLDADTQPEPEPEPDDGSMVDVDFESRKDGDRVVIVGTYREERPKDDSLYIEGFGYDIVWIEHAEATARRRALPLPTNEGAVIRCLIDGLNGPQLAERSKRIGELVWWVPGYSRGFSDGQIARVLAVLDEGKAS